MIDVVDVKEWDDWLYDTLVKIESAVIEMPGTIDAYRAYRIATAGRPSDEPQASERIQRMVHRNEHNMITAMLECHRMVNDLLMLEADVTGHDGR